MTYKYKLLKNSKLFDEFMNIVRFNLQLDVNMSILNNKIYLFITINQLLSCLYITYYIIIPTIT